MTKANEIRALERELKRLETKAEKFCHARASLPPGSSRARVTTANARWAAAAEAREDTRRRLDALLSRA